MLYTGLALQGLITIGLINITIAQGYLDFVSCLMDCNCPKDKWYSDLGNRKCINRCVANLFTED